MAVRLCPRRGSRPQQQCPSNGDHEKYLTTSAYLPHPVLLDLHPLPGLFAVAQQCYATQPPTSTRPHTSKLHLSRAARSCSPIPSSAHKDFEDCECGGRTGEAIAESDPPSTVLTPPDCEQPSHHWPSKRIHLERPGVLRAEVTRWHTCFRRPVFCFSILCAWRRVDQPTTETRRTPRRTTTTIPTTTLLEPQQRQGDGLEHRQHFAH